MQQGIAEVLLSGWLGLWGTGSQSQPEEPSGVVLMAPDLPEAEVDEHLIARVRAAAAEGEAILYVVRYDPAAFDPATLVERSRRRAGENLAAAVLWLDLRGPDGVALYLFEVEGDRVLGRRVPIVEGSTAAAHEALANIASSVVAEAIEGPITGLAELDPETLEESKPEPEPEPEPEPKQKPEPKPEPKPKPEPPTVDIPRPSFPRLWLSLAYAGQSFSDDPVFGHGLALGAAWGPARGAFVGLRYDLVLPLSLDVPEVRMSLRRHPISAEGGYRFAFAPRWDFELAGRITVDPIRRLTDERGDLVPTADDWRVFSSGALGAGFGISPIPELRVGLRLGAEVLTSRANYAVNDPVARAILSPHPVRGFVELGLAFATLWRPSHKK